MDIQLNLMQQIPMRSFCVNHLGGFTLLGNTESLNWTIANNSNVQVVEEPSLDCAYVRGCDQYVRDEWARNPYQQPLLPRFEDVLRAPYYAPGFVAQIPSIRFFATVHRDYVGIYDNVQSAVEFIDYFAPSGLKEFSTVDDAKLWLNERFILPMLVMSTYVTDPIEYIKNLPLNSAVPVRYRQWWEHNLPAVNNMPFVQPQFLLPPKEE